MNCRVVVEAAVPVYDVETADEAVRIAISKTGEMLNPDLNYVEINMRGRSCPHCGEEIDPAFIAADESLVALELEMTVFNVERDEHAARIARKEIGQLLENIPLTVLEIEELPEDDEEAAAATDEEEEEEEEEADADEGGTEDDGRSETDRGEEADDTQDGDRASADPMSAAPGDGDAESRHGDDVLPEFEELIDE